jgi:hypothetical protein
MTNGRSRPQLHRVRTYLAARKRSVDVLRHDVQKVRRARRAERDGGQVRVRLLIDVSWPESRITEIGERAASQEEVRVTNSQLGMLGGRLVGAQRVEANATLAEPERKP